MTPTPVAVVGAGWWATTVHLPALVRNPDARLVAVCDPDPTRARAAAERFGAERAFTDLDELLDSRSAAAAVIATPHSTHAALVERCLRGGLHVLVEKPMVTDAEDAWRLVATASEMDRVLAVGLSYQYASTAERVRRAVQTSIGELTSVNAEFSSGTLALFLTTDPSQADLDDPSVPHGTTYSDPATGGGQAHTQLTHLLSAVLWAAGDQAVEVAAMVDRRGLGVDVVDGFVFRLGRGAVGVASSTGTTPAGAPPRHAIRFHGTEGVVEWDMLGADAWVFKRGGAAEHFVNPPDRAPYARDEVSATFLRVIAGSVVNPAPADAAAAGVSLIDAALQAARDGRTASVRQGVLAAAPID